MTELPTVDFPAPLSPTKPRTSPFATEIDTLLTAVTCPLRDGKSTLRLLISSKLFILI